MENKPPCPAPEGDKNEWTTSEMDMDEVDEQHNMSRMILTHINMQGILTKVCPNSHESINIIFVTIANQL